MSEDNSIYSVVGVVCATDDAPGVCTPIFRNDDGDRYFIQSFDNRHCINSFEYIGEEVYGHYVPVLRNATFTVGSEVQFGLCLPHSSIKIADLDEIRHFFRENTHLFSPFPFMFYQVAILTRSQAAILDAFGMKQVTEAIAKRRIPVVFPRPKSEQGKWTDNATRVLEILWDYMYSAGEIARVLGFSRNAVVGKAKRLGLKSRPKGIDLFDDFDDMETNPSDKRGRFKEGVINVDGKMKLGKIRYA